MERPTGLSSEDESARRKYDAWKSEEGLSKTEAKRRYISYLIDTMKTYASGTHEARELLGELEYLWDQIKDVIPSPSPPMTPIPQILSGAGGVTSLGGSLYGDSFLDDRSGYLHNSSVRHSGEYLSRDVAVLKKEVSLALRRINEELNQISHIKKENGDKRLHRRNSGGSGIEYGEILKKIGVWLIKFLGGVAKRFIIDLIILISVIKFIKFKNGVDIDLLKNGTTLQVGSINEQDKSFFNKLLFVIFKLLNKVNLVSFNRLYLEID